MANMFKKAADKAADPKTTKARAKKAGNEIPTPGLQEYAALDTAIKTMETLKETFKGSLHEEMQTRFATHHPDCPRLPPQTIESGDSTTFKKSFSTEFAYKRT